MGKAGRGHSDEEAPVSAAGQSPSVLLLHPATPRHPYNAHFAAARKRHKNAPAGQGAALCVRMSLQGCAVYSQK